MCHFFRHLPQEVSLPQPTKTLHTDSQEHLAPNTSLSQRLYPGADLGFEKGGLFFPLSLTTPTSKTTPLNINLMDFTEMAMNSTNRS